jgi:hypothetical protein
MKRSDEPRTKQDPRRAATGVRTTDRARSTAALLLEHERTTDARYSMTIGARWPLAASNVVSRLDEQQHLAPLAARVRREVEKSTTGKTICVVRATATARISKVAK